MKPLHAKWIVSFYDATAGWRKSKIEEVFNSEQDIESNPFL